MLKKMKLRYFEQTWSPQLYMLSDGCRHSCILISGLNCGPFYQSKTHIHKATGSFTTVCTCHVLLVLCKCLIKSNSLESKDESPQSTFLP